MPHYEHAPIAEAVFDIGVTPDGQTQLSSLGVLPGEIAAIYTCRKDIMVARGDISLGATIGASATQTQTGFAFSTGNQKYIAQFRLDGFTLSRLAPYESWQRFRNEALRMWGIYASCARPTGVTRAALRYVNRFDLPLPVVDLQEYIRTVPEVSPEMPNAQLSGYFMHLELPQPDIGATLMITETIVPPEVQGTLAIVLDLHLVKALNLSCPVDATLQDLFEALRTRKNMIFEACITERARRLIR